MAKSITTTNTDILVRSGGIQLCWIQEVGRSIPSSRILGTLRFGIDVTLLLLYYSAFLATPDFGNVLILHNATFGLYELRSLIRIAEYRDLTQSRPRLEVRAIISTIFFALFFALRSFYDPSKESMAVLTWILVLYAFIVYRTGKPPKREEVFLLRSKSPASSTEKT